MSTISAAGVGPSDAARPARGGDREPQPRVRHLAREAVVLMVFSAATSMAVAGCLLLLTTLGSRG